MLGSNKEKDVISYPMQDTTHLEGSPDPGGSPDKGASPQSTAFLTVQSVSEVPGESVFSRGTQPAE